VYHQDEADSSDSDHGSNTSLDTAAERDKKKRRKLEDWVISNPVNTTLHPTMDLPGKRLKIQQELTGQQLTDRLTQHGLDLDTLVPVIEAWDATLSDYDKALSTEIERRRARILKLEDARPLILAKQQTNAQAIQLPTFTCRATSLTKRLASNTAKTKKLREGTDTLKEQQDAVRFHINSMTDYTWKAEAEVSIVRGLIRANARDMIRSALATRQEQAPQSTPTAAAAAEEPVARHLAFGNHPPPRQDSDRQPT
jgi:hypothetical protein